MQVGSLSDDKMDLSKLLLPIQPDDHIQGALDALYTLVEYGDYECPDCGRLFVTISALRTRLGENIRLVFRHYPRSGLHPRAQEAAEAAEAAGAQGKFWEMHHLLFANQNALTSQHLYKYAELLQLDAKRFRDEISHRTYEDRVREDFRRGVANGVYGTPGLFINGIRYDGALDENSLLTQVQRRCCDNVDAPPHPAR